MGLDISVFVDDPDDEIDGCRLGHSTDFERFRDVVSSRLDRRFRRTRFPSLMNADAWEGSWDATQAAVLEHELSIIAAEFSKLPHEPQPGEWQVAVREECGLTPTSLLESFITINGDLLVLRMFELAQIVQRENGFMRMG